MDVASEDGDIKDLARVAICLSVDCFQPHIILKEIESI